jgi:hypothetical protein
MVPFRVITNAVFRVAAAWCRNPRQGRLSGTLLPLGLWRSNGASGPEPPLANVSNAALQHHRTGQSCITQHFGRLKRRCADSAAIAWTVHLTPDRARSTVKA